MEPRLSCLTLRPKNTAVKSHLDVSQPLMLIFKVCDYSLKYLEIYVIYAICEDVRLYALESCFGILPAN